MKSRVRNSKRTALLTVIGAIGSMTMMTSTASADDTSPSAAPVTQPAAAQQQKQSAGAASSAYCRKVKARSSSDAALLLGPSIRVEGVKLPTAFQRGGTLDPTGMGHDYQVRAGFTVSPLDMYKGVKVLDVGDADCGQHDALVVAQEILTQDKDYGRLPALKKELAALDSKRSTWETIHNKSEERFGANATTLQQVEDIRERTVSLERRRAQLTANIQRLEGAGASTYNGSLDGLIQSIQASSGQYEEKVSHVRNLDAWDFRVTGGYIPPVFGATSSDFFGLVQISYNLGGPWRGAAETRYSEARRDELKNDRHEVVGRLNVFKAACASTVTQSKREIEVLDGRITALRASKEALEAAEGLRASHALSLIELELIAAETDRAFLTELVAQLSHS